MERVARVARHVWRYICAAPGTYLWLLFLGLNTIALTQMPPRYRHWWLETHSTNLAELSHHPVKVLISSAFWTQTPSFLFWFVVFNIFLVPVERRLGTARWLAVVALAHVGATLISEGTVRLLIDAGLDSRREVFTLDIGVSYGVAGAVGVLVWLIDRPWRWWYLAITAVFFALLLASGTDYTNLGHLCAYLIGLACRPLTRGKTDPGIDPRKVIRGVRQRVGKSQG
ncbi:rhomboid family intramembrane serine protease [Streptacidiphilus anmyonensis]|uniref:rhomboid family intramembrane serine protease n=1 Tax=Streptacidiphilus anmyonensis TaxID=405782 RepID=UPI0005AAA210|nr:rhomboid family intramembrane serine protease [Streptacidiphilus anmyonensis]